MFNRVALLSALLVSTLSAKIIHIDSVEQYNELNKGTLITMFTAVWCGPCKQVKPHYIALSDEYDDITFGMIDFDDKELMNAIDPTIKGIPAFVFTHEGTELDRVVGVRPKSMLRQTIEKFRASVTGQEYEDKGPELLTADEYHQKGLEIYKALVDECEKPEFNLENIGHLLVNEDILPLMYEMQEQDAERVEKAFELYKAHLRGALKSLDTYKPHTDPQDSYITFMKNTTKATVSVASFEEAIQSSPMNEKAQERMQGISPIDEPELFWQTMAELTAIEE